MYTSFIILVLCVPAFGFNSRFLSNRFNRLVVFGDSYADTGNAYQLTNRTYPISPPYYKGRYSNGPNWIDRFRVVKKLNYAYGSATTDNNLVVGRTKLGTIPVPGIRQQVATYLNKTHPTIIDTILPTLHIICSSGNDFVFNPTMNPLSSVNSLMNSVKDLLNVGVKNLVVFNQLPIQSLPYTKRFNQTQALTQLTIGLNAAIAANLAALQQIYTNAKIYLFDFNALFTKILSNTLPMTFINTVDGCWKVVNTTTVNKNCSKPNQYVFIDDFHFTGPVNQLITDAFQPFLSNCYRNNTPNSYFRSF